MKLRIASAVLFAGMAQSALGQGRIQFQVSPALQENWSSSIDALPGQAIDLRALITYTGTQSPIGLSVVFYQPAISNWDVDGASTDAILPFVDHGGADTIPRGDVPDAPGQYGRVSPFGFRTPGPNYFTPFHNVAGGVSYLRISTSNHSNWVGEAGNTTGGGGVSASQPPAWYIAQTPDYPYAFNTGLTDLVVLKLGIVLSQDADPRTLVVNTTEAFAGQAPNVNTTFRWFHDPSDSVGTIQGPAEYIPASIHVVPAPWSPFAMGVLATSGARRRRARPDHIP